MKAIRILVSLLFAVILGGMTSQAIGLGPNVGAITLTAVNLGLHAFNVQLPVGILSLNAGALPWVDGQCNLAGLQTTGYYAAVEWVDNFPALPTSPATFGEGVVLESVVGFTMDAGKQFFPFYSTLGKNFITDEVIGEVDARGFKSSITLFFPGASQAKALEWAAWANNSGIVVIGIDSQGVMRVVGSKAFPAKVDTNSITTGEGPEGTAGQTVVIYSYGCTPAPIYEGNIPTTPAAGSGS